MPPLSLNHAGLFEASPNPYLVLDRRLHVVAANPAYLRATGRELDDIVGRWAWDAFPTDPETLRQSMASFERVIATGEPDTMALLRFDIPRPEAEGGGFEERWWSITHAPVLDEGGEVALVLQHPIDVTEVQRLRAARDAEGAEREAARSDAARTGLIDRAAHAHAQNLGLKAETAQLRALLESAPGFTCVLRGPLHVFEFTNAAYDQLVGRSGLVGLPVREALPDVAGQGFYELLDRVYATGERFVASGVPIRLRPSPEAPEEERVLAFIYQPIRAEDGAVGGIFVQGHDVTEQARAEAALRELNATLEARVAEALAERQVLVEVVESTSAAIVVCDPDHRVLAINQAHVDAFERAYGWRLKSGDDYLDPILDPSERARVAEALARALGGEEVMLVDEFGAPGRERRTLEVRFNPLRDRDGRQVGAVQTAYDVTERVQAEERLAVAETARREADALYRAYFENTAESLFVVGVLDDGDFTIEDLNPAHQASTGLDLSEVRGRRIEEQLPPEVAKAVAGNYRRAAEAARPIGYRETIELPGGLRHWDTVLVPVRGKDGRIARIVGSARDVTAQVQAEEALRQSQKMEAVGSLTGGVAHDFNNLLTPILGALDRLATRASLPERDARLVEGALQSAERARTLVQRLLAFARRQPLQPRAVDVAELVRGMAGLVASTAGPQIRVAVSAAPGLPPALADANQLEMAILNLAVNARDAMPDGGTLRISALEESVRPGHPSGAAPGCYLRVSVADTGTGMDEATLARAVEPFFSTKGVGRGTGLGLSMAHGLAAQLGGALTLQSRPGLGTNVELWLPAARAEAPADAGAPKPLAPEAAPAARGTALLVDDEDLVRATAADMLAELGYEVVEAASAEDALRRLDAGLRPDLLVTDHLMPGLTGSDLARIAAARHPGLPVLVVSGYADASGIAADLPRLAKPFRRADLAASLAGLRAA